MNTSHEFANMFEAFQDAQIAYESLHAKGLGRPDRELARDSEHLEFHRCGMKLAQLGGPSAIRGAISMLSQSATDSRSSVRAELERLWAGMGIWSN